MIDLHCHLLPGIDDGPETIEESLAIARAAVLAGTRTIVATPHVNWRFPNTAAVIAAAVTELSARLLAEGLALDVLAGAEIAMTRIGEIPSEELAKLALAGGTWLLVEPPFTPVASGLDTILLELQRQGHRILLAHPERCPAFHRDPKMLEALVEGGILTSITAGSLAGQFGEEPRRFGVALLARGMAHNVASDAHDEINRGPAIAGKIEQAGLGALTDWLTRAVPAALVAGRASIPPRPAVDLSDIPAAPRSRWRHRSRRSQR